MSKELYYKDNIIKVESSESRRNQENMRNSKSKVILQLGHKWHIILSAVSLLSLIQGTSLLVFLIWEYL